jgi:plastocyanin
MTHRTAWAQKSMIIAGLLAAAAGCGAGQSHPAASSPRATTVPPASQGKAGASAAPSVVPTPIRVMGNTVQYHGQRSVAGQTSTTVEMHDVYFSPSVLVGSPGQKLTITVVNDGNIAHTFTIASQGIDLVLASGERKNATVTFPRSGRTAWICRYHISDGMAGILVAGA